MQVIIMLLIFLILLIGAQATIFLKQSPTIQPNTAGSPNTKYYFRFETQSSITLTPTTSLLLQFPTSQFALNFVNNCSLSINGATNTTSCSLGSNNRIQFTNIVASSVAFNNFTIAFNTNGALYASTVNLTLYFMDGTANISDSSGSATYLIVAAQMTSCSVNSNSDTVGEGSSWTLSFTPAIQIQTGNSFRMTLNKWGPDSQSNFVNSSSIECSNGTCTTSSQSTKQYLLVTSMFTLPTNSSQTLKVSTLLNPSSTYPSNISFQILTGNNQVQSCNTQLSVSTPNTITVSFSPTLTQTISAVNSGIQMMLVQSVFLPSTGYILLSSALPISYTPVNLNGSTPIIVSSDNGLLIGGLSSTTIGNFFRMGNFSITNSVSVKAVPLTITSMIQVNSVFYKVNSATVNISSVVSQITTSKVEFNPQNANKLSQYTISFISVNNLISGSFITVLFPPETTLNSNSSCTSTLGVCSANSSTNSINITLSASVAKTSNVSIVITNVMNPYTTTTTSSFKIYSYYNSSDSMVDILESGLTVKATSNPMLDLTLSLSNSTVAAISNYKFDINFTNPALVSSVVIISFPSSIIVSSVSSDTCSLTATGNLITLVNCFNSNSSSLSVMLHGVKNPVSTQPSSNFNVTLSYKDSIVQYLNKVINVQMTSLAPMSIQIQPTNSTVNANTSYKFTITFTQLHSSNDTLIIKMPASMVNISNVQCTPISGVSSIVCSNKNPNIQATLTFSTFPSNYTIQFFLSTITNNWYVSTATFQVTSLSNTYEMQTGSAEISFTVGGLLVSVSNDHNIKLLGISTIVFTFTPPFVISNNGLQITIYLPSNSLNGTTCSGGNIQCLISNNIVSISNINNFQSALPVSVIANTGYFQSTSSFSVILSYNTNPVAQNDNVIVSAFCKTPCKQCLSINKSSCINCLPSPYTSFIYLVPFNHTCVSQCPSTTFLLDLTCSLCSPTCQNCSVTSTNCTSCNIGTYLYNNACPGTCPNGTYPKDKKCQTCSSSCKTCSSFSQCTSCPEPMYLFNSTCSSTCPESYYADSSKNCQSCGNCQICSSPTNCTACKNNYYLLGNKCYESCPSSFPIPSDGTCLPCDSSCLTCRGQTINCTSCNNGTFLYSNRCLLSCPESYVANRINNICESVETSMIYFPGTISSAIFTILAAFSRLFFSSTSLTTSLVGLYSIPQSVVYCYYTYLLAIGGSKISLAMAIGALCVLLVLSISFVLIMNIRIHRVDQYYKHWFNSFKVVSWIFNMLSSINYKIYRLQYSRLFGLEALSACYKKSDGTLYLTTGITITGNILVEILMIISNIATLYFSTLKNQLYLQSIDTLIISAIIALVSILDIPKAEDYFLNSPFLKNRVSALDARNNLMDEVGDVGGEHHESCHGKGNFSVYKMQSGQYFDVTTQKIKLGDESVAESLNTGMIPIDSQTLKNLQSKHLDSKQNDLENQLDKNRNVQSSEIIDQLMKFDQQQMEEEAQRMGSPRKSIKTQSIKSSKSKKSEELGEDADIDHNRSIPKKKRIFNIFDPIQQQTEEELLHELQSFQSQQNLGDNAFLKRPRSQSKHRDQQFQKSQQRLDRSTVSAANKRQLRQKWNNIIKSKVQKLKKKDQGLKPIPVITINQMSETSSMKGMYRKRKLKKPKKQYHNKQLESIYLQRIVPPTKNTRSRSFSAKQAFRSSKYKFQN